MQVLSRFYGIVIRMYFRQAEHNPPHIHAQYGDWIVSISINDFRVMSGGLPPRAMKLVLEWMNIHQEELLDMWNTQKIHKVEALS
mgnify:CR=1 FL=1